MTAQEYHTKLKELYKEIREHFGFGRGFRPYTEPRMSLGKHRTKLYGCRQREDVCAYINEKHPELYKAELYTSPGGHHSVVIWNVPDVQFTKKHRKTAEERKQRRRERRNSPPSKLTLEFRLGQFRMTVSKLIQRRVNDVLERIPNAELSNYTSSTMCALDISRDVYEILQVEVAEEQS